jgi:nucleotide-binding universal stress UspA family protein
MIETVLVPVDGSPLSRKALRHALREFPDASITVVHVIDLFDPGHDASPGLAGSYEPLMGSQEWYERAEDVSEQILSDAEELAADHDRAVSTASEIGDPERIVVAYAAEEGIDQIVLGAHGRTTGERPIFGTVAETVARRASVPVTLIR